MYATTRTPTAHEWIVVDCPRWISQNDISDLMESERGRLNYGINAKQLFELTGVDCARYIFVKMIFGRMENRGEDAYGGRAEKRCWNLCEAKLNFGIRARQIANGI